MSESHKYLQCIKTTKLYRNYSTGKLIYMAINNNEHTCTQELNIGVSSTNEQIHATKCILVQIVFEIYVYTF